MAWLRRAGTIPLRPITAGNLSYFTRAYSTFGKEARRLGIKSFGIEAKPKGNPVKAT
jgi:hypothetical protein